MKKCNEIEGVMVVAQVAQLDPYIPIEITPLIRVKKKVAGSPKDREWQGARIFACDQNSVAPQTAHIK